MKPADEEQTTNHPLGCSLHGPISPIVFPHKTLPNDVVRCGRYCRTKRILPRAGKRPAMSGAPVGRKAASSFDQRTMRAPVVEERQPRCERGFWSELKSMTTSSTGRKRRHCLTAGDSSWVVFWCVVEDIRPCLTNQYKNTGFLMSHPLLWVRSKVGRRPPNVVDCGSFISNLSIIHSGGSKNIHRCRFLRTRNPAAG